MSITCLIQADPLPPLPPGQPHDDHVAHHGLPGALCPLPTIVNISTVLADTTSLGADHDHAGHQHNHPPSHEHHAPEDYTQSYQALTLYFTLPEDWWEIKAGWGQQPSHYSHLNISCEKF